MRKANKRKVSSSFGRDKKVIGGRFRFWKEFEGYVETGKMTIF